MIETSSNSTETTDCEFVSSRVINAPRELVFRALIEPEHLKNWWGPKGFTNTFEEFNPHPGGVWRFVMQGPDGKDYRNQHIFEEIVKPERIVMNHVSGPKFRLTITLDDQAGKTSIDWHMQFETAEECANIKKYAVAANEQNFDRLEAELARMQAASGSSCKPFIISRTFNASRDRVWKAWSNRGELMRWFGPNGFTMPAAKMDFRPGGSFHYCLESADGNEMWGKFAYREIVEPERIVLVNSFSNEDGELTRHPFSATWPLEMLSTTTLTEENGKTKLTIECDPLNPSDEERKTFDGAHEGMKIGWTGTFDQLAAYLAKA